MKLIRNWVILLLLTLVTALNVIACSGFGGGGSDKTIRVGSKDFTEAFILGEMYALVLENNGFTVDRKLNLGGTPVAQSALVENQIDLYPEYTGTGLLTVLKLPQDSDRDRVYKTVADNYKQKFNLVWLDPSPMNNTNAFATTQEVSQRLGIKTISDMVRNGSQLTIVAPPEFTEREDGLPGVIKVYGDPKFKKIIAADAGLRYKALQSGEADVTRAFSTDGEISAFNLVLLEDDKKLYPPYQVAPVVRQETLDQFPELRDVLNALAPKITDETMQRLNFEVSGKQREPAEVAEEFLTQAGLLNKS